MRRLAGSVFALALLAGCNAIFDISPGRPFSGCKDTLMIDDLEDGDGAICNTKDSAMRNGSWFVLSDGTSSQLEPAAGAPFTPTQIPDGRGLSRYAARMSGSGFTSWGARMGLNLKVEGLGVETYDASTIGGVSFWLKSNVPLVVELPIAATIPDHEGAGACVDGANEYNCGKHFAFPIYAPDPEQWVEYKIPFAALFQQLEVDGNGNARVRSATWNPTELVGIQLYVPQASFDVWIDDVLFYGCKTTECFPTCTDPTLPVGCSARGETPAACWPAGSNCETVPALDSSLTGVWGSGPGSLWVVGSSSSARGATVVRWNGSTWSSTRNGTSPLLAGVWGSGPGDVWAVGDQGTIMRWDGSAWSPPLPSIPTQSLQSVWGSGPDDVWAVGHGGTILHWNGTAWAKLTSGTSLWLTCVWGSGPDDVWAVGFSEAGLGGVTVHWNGAAWSVVPGGSNDLRIGVWAAAPDDAWTVGFGALGPSIAHWDGVRWSNVKLGTIPASALVSVWGSGPRDVWAVGDRGTIIHWDGATWTVVPSGTTQLLNRVWGSGPADVWAVGLYATILHWNGTAWSVLPPSAITVAK